MKRCLNIALGNFEIKGKIATVNPVVMDDGSIILIILSHIQVGWHMNVCELFALRLNVEIASDGDW
jgi:hypothetical protein